MPESAFCRTACTGCGKAMRSRKNTSTPTCYTCRAARNPVKPNPGTRVCPGCEQPFTPKRVSPTYPDGRARGDGSGWTVTCSKSCAMKMPHRSARARDPNWVPYYQSAKGKTKAPAQARKRRLLLGAAGWDGVTDHAILVRDGWVCGLCGEPIDPARRYPDPASPSVDHLTPLSCGGDDTQWNKRAAHLGCNVARGNRLPADVQLTFTYTGDYQRPVLEPCSICGVPKSVRRTCQRHKPLVWCWRCKHVIPRGRPNQRWCSSTCRKGGKPARQRQPRECSASGCTNPGTFGKGCCVGHYQRLVKHGDVFAEVPLSQGPGDRRRIGHLIKQAKQARAYAA